MTALVIRGGHLIDPAAGVDALGKEQPFLAAFYAQLATARQPQSNPHHFAGRVAHRK